MLRKLDSRWPWRVLSADSKQTVFKEVPELKCPQTETSVKEIRTKEAQTTKDSEVWLSTCVPSSSPLPLPCRDSGALSVTTVHTYESSV